MANNIKPWELLPVWDHVFTFMDVTSLSELWAVSKDLHAILLDRREFVLDRKQIGGIGRSNVNSLNPLQHNVHTGNEQKQLTQLVNSVFKYNKLYHVEISYNELVDDEFVQKLFATHGATLAQCTLQHNLNLKTPIFEQATSLLELDLKGCKNLMTPRFDAPNLRSLDLSYSFINDLELQKSFPSHLDHLTTLVLFGCKNVTSLTLKCPKLIKLDLSRTHVTDAALKEIMDVCPMIEHLTLSGCPAIKAPVVHSKVLKHLSFLDCGRVEGITRFNSQRKFERADLKCSALETLIVSSCDILDDALVQMLEGCKNLQKLEMNDCRKLVCPDIEITLSALKTVSMSRSGFSVDGVVNVLAACCNLQNLNLRQYLLRSDLAEHLIDKMTARKALLYVRSDQKTNSVLGLDADIMGLDEDDEIKPQNDITSQNLPLQTLILTATRLSDETMDSLLSLCQTDKLETLELGSCSQLTLNNWYVHLDCVKHLNLAFTTVTDVTVKQLFTVAKKLETIVLERCDLLETLTIASTSLRVLNIKSSRHLRHLELNCPNLEHLNIAGCLVLKNIDGLRVCHDTVKSITMTDCYRVLFRNLISTYRDHFSFKMFTEMPEERILREIGVVCLTGLHAKNVKVVENLLLHDSKAQDNIEFDSKFDDELVTSHQGEAVAKTVVQWQWKNGLTWEPYDARLNHYIEACYRVRNRHHIRLERAMDEKDAAVAASIEEKLKLENLDIVKFALNGQKYEVDLNAMYQANVGKGRFRRVQRATLKRGPRDVVDDAHVPEDNTHLNSRAHY